MPSGKLNLKYKNILNFFISKYFILYIDLIMDKIL